MRSGEHDGKKERSFRVGGPSEDHVVREMELTGVCKTSKEATDQGGPKADGIGQWVKKGAESGDESISEDEHRGAEDVGEVEGQGTKAHADGRCREHPSDVEGIHQVVV